jgi:hypothetical protein
MPGGLTVSTMTTTPPEQAATFPQATPPAKKQTGLITAAALAAALVLGCVLAAVLGHTDNSAEAKAQCESWVSQRLVSPGSAHFSDETAAAAGKEWTVTGTVDSQNLLGGLVRNTWTCVVRDGGQTWTLESLTGLNN